MLSLTYEITTALSHTDELISPPYDIAIVTISYGRVTKSPVWDSMMSKKNMGWPFYAAVSLGSPDVRLPEYVIVIVADVLPRCERDIRPSATHVEHNCSAPEIYDEIGFRLTHYLQKSCWPTGNQVIEFMLPCPAIDVGCPSYTPTRNSNENMKKVHNFLVAWYLKSGPWFNIKMLSHHIGNSIVELRWSYDRLTSTMGFLIMVKQYVYYMESGRCWPHAISCCPGQFGTWSY